MFELLKIIKSPSKNKKYRADINLDGHIYRNVDFGDDRHQQFKDSTPLKFYSHLDHGDMKRLHNYYMRNANNNGPAAFLSKHYLW